MNNMTKQPGADVSFRKKRRDRGLIKKLKGHHSNLAREETVSRMGKPTEYRRGRVSGSLLEALGLTLERAGNPATIKETDSALDALEQNRRASELSIPPLPVTGRVPRVIQQYGHFLLPGHGSFTIERERFRKKVSVPSSPSMCEKWEGVCGWCGMVGWGERTASDFRRNISSGRQELRFSVFAAI